MNSDIETLLYGYVPFSNMYNMMLVCQNWRHSGRKYLQCILSKKWLKDASIREHNSIINKSWLKLPKSLLLRKYRWNHFIRWISREKRLPSEDSCRLYHAIRDWKEGDREWATETIERLYQVPEQYVSSPSSICHRQLEELPRKVRLKVHKKYYYEHPFLKHVNKGVVAKAVESGWLITDLWTLEISREIEHLEQNPLRMLNQLEECPFCGTSYKVSLNAQCAMLFAKWGNFIVKVKKYQCVNYREKQFHFKRKRFEKENISLKRRRKTL